MLTFFNSTAGYYEEGEVKTITYIKELLNDMHLQDPVHKVSKLISSIECMAEMCVFVRGGNPR
jgi:hypothetical protein